MSLDKQSGLSSITQQSTVNTAQYSSKTCFAKLGAKQTSKLLLQKKYMQSNSAKPWKACEKIFAATSSSRTTTVIHVTHRNSATKRMEATAASSCRSQCANGFNFLCLRTTSWPRPQWRAPHVGPCSTDPQAVIPPLRSILSFNTLCVLDNTAIRNTVV